jgi:hypothetical protein
MVQTLSTKWLAVLIALTTAVLVAVIPAQEIFAQDTTNACAGVALTGGACNGTGETSIGSVIRSVINIISILVGAISVIMIIIGGLRYMTSAGDSSAVSSAKNTILYAIVGLVIVIMAQAIVTFVLDKI